MMKKLLTGLIGGLIVLGVVGNAFAETFTTIGEITTVTEVDFVDFYIGSTSDVTVDILAYEPDNIDYFDNGMGNDLLDTVIYLFTSTGAKVGYSDDSWSIDIGKGGSDGSLSSWDSYLDMPQLAAGDYRLAVGSWPLQEGQAWAGYNGSGYSTGSYQVTITQHEITPQGGDPVPEPTTMLLFGTGLVGLVGTRLGRKKVI